MADAPDAQDALASYVAAPPLPRALRPPNGLFLPSPPLRLRRFMSITGADSGSALQFLEVSSRAALS